MNSDYYLLKFIWRCGGKHGQKILPTFTEDPKIDFRLTGTGRGTITIEYHVWKYTGTVKSSQIPPPKGQIPLPPKGTPRIRLPSRFLWIS